MSHVSAKLRKKERMEITLTTLIEYYVTTLKIKGCSEKTLKGKCSHLGMFVKFLGGKGHSLKLANLTLEDAREYVASLQGPVTKFKAHKFNRPVPNSTYSPQTVHTYVRDLRAFSNWLKNEGYTRTPLFDNLDLPKVPQKKIPILSPEEIAEILSSINPDTFIGSRLLAMVLLMLDTGIRAGELVGLKLANIDWERGS